MRLFARVLLALIAFLLLSVIAFGQSSDATLTTQSDVIRNETQASGNTKGRVADMFQGLIDSKVSILAPRLTTSSTNGYVWTANGTGGLGQWSAPAAGSGTVTSVSFTGGLISVGSPTTTPSFTVAGTSGGIPYFSSSSTWATSAALAANALVIGGGAGSAPSTTTTGTGVLTALGVNTGSAGAFVINGGALGTPSSGTLTSATGLPVSTGISGLGTGVATWLATPSWDNFNSAITGTSTYWSLATTSQTLTGNLAFAGSSSNQLAFNFSTLGANTGLTVNSTATDAASNTQRSFSALQSGANGTSTQTTTSGYFSNTKTGTASTNYAVHSVASGGTTNRALYADGGIEVTGTPNITFSNPGTIVFPNTQASALGIGDGSNLFLSFDSNSDRVHILEPIYDGTDTGTSGEAYISQGTSNPATWGTLGVSGGGTGAVTITGLLQGNGTSAITAITNSSTVGQALRVTGASTYAWGALDLADTDAITGDLPFANLTQGSALSVLGVTGNATADNASIAAGTDGHILRRSGTALAFGSIKSNFVNGTATNDAATAGNIGERVTSTVSTYTNYTTTATYQAITSISLTAGDWDVSAFFTYSSNSATITAASNAIFVISTTTASAAGATEGLNISYVPQAALLGTSLFSDSIAPFQVSLSGTTTYYLNSQATFTLGNPQFVGTIRAVRVR